jgi:hypothetical protein
MIFWRVSADTKMCGSPLSLAFWHELSPAGEMLRSSDRPLRGKLADIIPYFSQKSIEIEINVREMSISTEGSV